MRRDNGAGGGAGRTGRVSRGGGRNNPSGGRGSGGAGSKGKSNDTEQRLAGYLKADWDVERRRGTFTVHIYLTPHAFVNTGVDSSGNNGVNDNGSNTVASSASSRSNNRSGTHSSSNNSNTLSTARAPSGTSASILSNTRSPTGSSLSNLFGLWYDVFPFRLHELTTLKARPASPKRCRTVLEGKMPLPPWHIPRKDREQYLTPSPEELSALEQHNRKVVQTLTNTRSFISSRSGYGRRVRTMAGVDDDEDEDGTTIGGEGGGICSNDTSFSGTLKRYASETLFEDACSVRYCHHYGTRISWIARRFGVMAHHRDMCSSSDFSPFILSKGSGAFSGFRSYLCEDDHAPLNDNVSHGASAVIRAVQNFDGLLQQIENCGHRPADFIGGSEKEDGLTVPLLEFQRQTLGWAIERENTEEGIQSFLWTKLPMVTEDDQSKHKTRQFRRGNDLMTDGDHDNDMDLIMNSHSSLASSPSTANYDRHKQYSHHRSLNKKENNSLSTAPSSQRQKHHLYFSPALDRVSHTPPRKIRGGFLCEEMGLGKTLISLALILHNPAPAHPPSCTHLSDSPNQKFPGWFAEDSLSSPAHVLDSADSSTRKQSPRGSILSRGTLVVCSVSLVGQWIEEAKSKLRNPGLVYSYHGARRTKNPEELAGNAIVVTTYSTLASDATYHAKKNVRNNVSNDTAADSRSSSTYNNSTRDYCPPCEQVKWWRIICDESHCLRDAGTQASKAVRRLAGENKWCVTGTPFVTSTIDIWNQMQFLGMDDLNLMFGRFARLGHNVGTVAAATSGGGGGGIHQASSTRETVEGGGGGSLDTVSNTGGLAGNGLPVRGGRSLSNLSTNMAIAVATAADHGEVDDNVVDRDNNNVDREQRNSNTTTITTLATTTNNTSTSTTNNDTATNNISITSELGMTSHCEILNDSIGLGNLLFVLRSLMIRHSIQQRSTSNPKDNLTMLPSKIEREIIIEFSDKERKVYDELENNALLAYEHVLNACCPSDVRGANVLNNGLISNPTRSRVGASPNFHDAGTTSATNHQSHNNNRINRHYIHLMAKLLPLRTACSGGPFPQGHMDAQGNYKSVAGNINEQQLSFGTPGINGTGGGVFMHTQQRPYQMKEEDHLECSICLEPFASDAVATKCRPIAHIFCKECIEGVLTSTSASSSLFSNSSEGLSLEGPCPICRKSIKSHQLRIALKPKSVVMEEAVASGLEDVYFESKFLALVEELKRVCRMEPQAKCLIFSQFTTTLNWMKKELPKHGFQFRTLSGSMTMEKRTKALRDFQNDPPSTIFLMSMRSGSVGINLTQANRVYIMEPGMNPAMEAQAIGRVHRLGQTKRVEVIRLTMKDTVESRMRLLLQRKYGIRSHSCSTVSINSNASSNGVDEITLRKIGRKKENDLCDSSNETGSITNINSCINNDMTRGNKMQTHASQGVGGTPENSNATILFPEEASNSGASSSSSSNIMDMQRRGHRQNCQNDYDLLFGRLG